VQLPSFLEQSNRGCEHRRSLQFVLGGMQTWMRLRCCNTQH